MKRHINFLIPVILFLCFAWPVSGQESCGSTEALKRYIQEHPEYLKQQKTNEQHAQDGQRPDEDGDLPVITIPVVVHVVWYSGAPSQNISDDQINSQIAVLNADFRRQNFDVSYVPSYFENLIADVQVEFCLAKRTPDCQATNGITRTESNKAQWTIGENTALKSTSQGGADAWDRDKYLNIWVCNLVGYTGYAQEPGGEAATDGVVIKYTCFGTTGTATYPHNQGRVATHEVGHWLDLIHIFGQDNPDDGCSGDDLVYDTPNQSVHSSGCPEGIQISCNNGPFGNLYMNYMDYTDDACMYMFTKGQKVRMRAALNGPRSGLASSDGCVPLNSCDFLPPFTVSNISGPGVLCTSGIQQYGAFTSTISPYVPGCMMGVWSVSWPGGLQIVNQTVADDGTTSVLIKALQPGAYTLTFTVTTRACAPIVMSKSYQVQVCAAPNPPISVPPPGLNSICSFNDPECYSFSSSCGLTFILSTPDPNLVASVSGPAICLSSNFYKRRTSRLNVTPVNACGQGPTAIWYISIDNPNECLYLTPPAGADLQTETSLQATDGSSYIVSSKANEIRIEDLDNESPPARKNIRLLAIDGRLLLSYDTEDPLIQIDLGQEYPSGIYLLRIEKNGQVYTKKVAVQY